MPNKPQRYSCRGCGESWVSTSSRCPNGCSALAKSDGEFTRKTFQGDDDLKKGG